MALDQAFVTYIVERLEPLGTITTKRMFGGCGVFCDGKMFCKISPSRTVSFKADDESVSVYRNAGMRKSGKMNYYELGSEQLEDEQAFLDMATLALSASKQ